MDRAPGITFRRFLSGLSGRLALFIIVIVIVAIGSFETWRSRALSYDGLWNARTSLWSGLLVFANLVILWWYALRTEDLAKVSQAQHALSMKQYLEANKPIVVVAPVRNTNDPNNVHYALNNIGAGIAVNIYEITITGGKRRSANFTNLGGLAPAAQPRLLPPELNRRFQKGATEAREAQMILLTETMFSRTTAAWIGTVNRLGDDGEVVHYLVRLPGLDRREYSLPELLKTFGRSIEQQVAGFTDARRRSFVPVEWTVE